MIAGSASISATTKSTQPRSTTGKHVVENHSYPCAKVQLAEIYFAKKQNDLARDQLKDVVNDDVHAPTFQRKRDRVWIRRAKAAMKMLPN